VNINVIRYTDDTTLSGAVAKEFGSLEIAIIVSGVYRMTRAVDSPYTIVEDGRAWRKITLGMVADLLHGTASMSKVKRILREMREKDILLHKRGGKGSPSLYAVNVALINSIIDAETDWKHRGDPKAEQQLRQEAVDALHYSVGQNDPHVGQNDPQYISIDLINNTNKDIVGQNDPTMGQNDLSSTGDPQALREASDRVKGMFSFMGARPVDVALTVSEGLHDLFVAYAEVNNTKPHRIPVDKAVVLTDLFFLDNLSGPELRELYSGEGSWWATMAESWRREGKPHTTHISQTLDDARDWAEAIATDSPVASGKAEQAWDEFWAARRTADLNRNWDSPDETGHEKRRRAGMMAAGNKDLITNYNLNEKKAAFIKAYNEWGDDGDD